MNIMKITESAKAKARDFIDNEKQFQLGFLPTEQSNPITATLEEGFKRSTVAGVQCLQRGDRQMAITKCMEILRDRIGLTSDECKAIGHDNSLALIA